MVATDLPFSTSTARKLREIAAFVEEGQVPLDRLPEAMSTLYAKPPCWTTPASRHWTPARSTRR